MYNFMLNFNNLEHIQIFFETRRFEVKKWLIWFPWKWQQWQFVSSMAMDTILATGESWIFASILNVINDQRVLSTLKFHSTDWRTLLIHLLNSSLKRPMLSPLYPDKRNATIPYAGSPYMYFEAKTSRWRAKKGRSWLWRNIVASCRRPPSAQKSGRRCHLGRQPLGNWRNVCACAHYKFGAGGCYHRPPIVYGKFAPLSHRWNQTHWPKEPPYGIQQYNI